MNFVFISPHFPPNFYNFCVELKKAGATVLAIGDTPQSEFRQELKDSITEYAQVDMSNYDKVYKAIALFSSKYGKIDRIDSQNEHWLTLEAQIRDDFNIFGQKPKHLKINQSKLGMKTVYNEVGVPCVDAIPLSVSPDILGEFVNRNGYPFIIKPDKGVGASNTYKVENQDQLFNIIKDLPPGYVIEPFVKGQIVTFDGLADRNGEIIFFATFELSNDVLSSLKYQTDAFYFYNRYVDPQLERYGRATVKGFKLKERFFHCEFFKSPTGEYKAIEINVRPPGGYAIDMMNYSCDINLYNIYAELAVKNNASLTYERKFNVATVLRRDRFHYTHSVEDVMKTLGTVAVEYKRLPEIFAAAMGNDTFILRHPDKQGLLDSIAYAMEKA